MRNEGKNCKITIGGKEVSGECLLFLHVKDPTDDEVKEILKLLPRGKIEFTGEIGTLREIPTYVIPLEIKVK